MFPHGFHLSTHVRFRMRYRLVCRHACHGRALNQHTSEYWRDEGADHAAGIDGEVEDGEEQRQHPLLVRRELVGAERGDARLNAAGAERDDAKAEDVEPRMQVGGGVLSGSERQQDLSGRVKNRDEEDRSEMSSGSKPMLLQVGQ